MNTAPDSVSLAMIRNIALIIATALTSHGLASANDANTIVGAITTLAMVGWSVFNKYRMTHVINVAMAQPAHSDAAIANGTARVVLDQAVATATAAGK